MPGKATTVHSGDEKITKRDVRITDHAGIPFDIVNFEFDRLKEELDAVKSVLKETKRTTCGSCGRGFGSFIDFPLVIVSKLTRCEPTSETSVALGLESVRKYLESIECMEISMLPPGKLLPPWEQDEWFTRAWIIPETMNCHDDVLLACLDEAKHDGPVEDREIDIRVYKPGKNMGAAGGPTIDMLGIIARITYRGIVNTGQIRFVTGDDDGLKKQVESILSDGDEPLKCECGNTKTFRLASWNVYFDVNSSDWKKIDRFHGGYKDKDIADMDDMILICSECQKIVLDTSW